MTRSRNSAQILASVRVLGRGQCLWCVLALTSSSIDARTSAREYGGDDEHGRHGDGAADDARVELHDRHSDWSDNDGRLVTRRAASSVEHGVGDHHEEENGHTAAQSLYARERRA